MALVPRMWQNQSSNLDVDALSSALARAQASTSKGITGFGNQFQAASDKQKAGIDAEILAGVQGLNLDNHAKSKDYFTDQAIAKRLGHNNFTKGAGIKAYNAQDDILRKEATDVFNYSNVKREQQDSKYKSGATDFLRGLDPSKLAEEIANPTNENLKNLSSQGFSAVTQPYGRAYQQQQELLRLQREEATRTKSIRDNRSRGQGFIRDVISNTPDLLNVRESDLVAKLGGIEGYNDFRPETKNFLEEAVKTARLSGNTPNSNLSVGEQINSAQEFFKSSSALTATQDTEQNIRTKESLQRQLPMSRQISEVDEMINNPGIALDSVTEFLAANPSLKVGDSSATPGKDNNKEASGPSLEGYLKKSASRDFWLPEFKGESAVTDKNGNITSPARSAYPKQKIAIPQQIMNAALAVPAIQQSALSFVGGNDYMNADDVDKKLTVLMADYIKDLQAQKSYYDIDEHYTLANADIQQRALKELQKTQQNKK